MSKSKKIIFAAIFLALTIVLGRFLAIKTPILKISFGFIGTLTIAMYLGPKWSTLNACLADVIGAILFPFGAYFPGYTLSAILSGFIYGKILYKGKNLEKYEGNKQTLLRIGISSFFVCFLVHGVINTFWVYITTGQAVFAILPVRIAKQLIMVPIQMIVMFVIEKNVTKLLKNRMKEKEND